MVNIISLIIPVLAGLLILKLVLSQIGCIWKIVANSLSGFVCLWLLNLLSGFTGILLPINLVTCLITGFLGVPGIILLVLGQLL
ncbi:MAG: pro-sigmaK processing inhibitor BofA family protein [Oscillospiraceae bacterium]|nr:pro-sigmaK processing inhibitor BofA family protein [Oscillospiraceae bacterium]